MNTMWFILGCCLIALEIGHPGLLYFAALGGGAFVAFVASWVGYSVEMQNVLYFIASFIFIVMVYVFVKHTNKDIRSNRSNTELLVGKIIMIMQVHTPKAGVSKIGGEIWSIKLLGEGNLEVGKKVIVIGVQGCHLQVQMIKNEI